MPEPPMRAAAAPAQAAALRMRRLRPCGLRRRPVGRMPPREGPGPAACPSVLLSSAIVAPSVLPCGSGVVARRLMCRRGLPVGPDRAVRHREGLHTA